MSAPFTVSRRVLEARIAEEMMQRVLGATFWRSVDMLGYVGRVEDRLSGASVPYVVTYERAYRDRGPRFLEVLVDEIRRRRQIANAMRYGE